MPKSLISSFLSQDILYPLEDPFLDKSHMQILKGNLAPDGAVLKISGYVDSFVGPTKVFETETEFIKSLNKIS